ncbi:MAG: hypothetical protein J7639_15600 [Paenibacillaceae bacterium]|nr:hypothetical protein [Paenibacillaceae bacterium]
MYAAAGQQFRFGKMGGGDETWGMSPAFFARRGCGGGLAGFSGRHKQGRIYRSSFPVDSLYRDGTMPLTMPTFK